MIWLSLRSVSALSGCQRKPDRVKTGSPVRLAVRIFMGGGFWVVPDFFCARIAALCAASSISEGRVALVASMFSIKTKVILVVCMVVAIIAVKSLLAKIPLIMANTAMTLHWHVNKLLTLILLCRGLLDVAFTYHCWFRWFQCCRP